MSRVDEALNRGLQARSILINVGVETPPWDVDFDWQPGDNILTPIGVMWMLKGTPPAWEVVPPTVVGAIGPQGPIGTQGVQGPVGVPGLDWRGPWADAAVYLIDDGVEALGTSYICVEAHVASAVNAPPHAQFWDLLAAQGLPSEPPVGKYRVTNLWVDPTNGKLTVEYDDVPV